MSDPTADPAISVFFKVEIDGRPLGAFTACEGMGVEVTIEQREAGGNNAFIHQLPGRLKYTNVKLTRAVNADTQLVAEWFSTMSGTVTRTNAHIAALRSDDHKTPIWHWDLTGVIPVRWTGPSLSADTAKVATETLELAHHGFLKG
ncbi:MAG: phage tail protein [Pseudonocardiales bacterium]|nr:MAG: phage tail protein [Pseudonocardiales bacterium]